MYTGIWMHVFIYVYVYICMYVCMHVRIYIYIYILKASPLPPAPLSRGYDDIWSWVRELKAKLWKSFGHVLEFTLDMSWACVERVVNMV